ncbi:MAG: hypothetical protein ACI9SQ_000968 [Rubritalea sp.]|jgi:hypothetical protein
MILYSVHAFNNNFFAISWDVVISCFLQWFVCLHAFYICLSSCFSPPDEGCFVAAFFADDSSA